MLKYMLARIGQITMKIFEPLMMAQQIRADRYLKTWGLRWNKDTETFY
jgi:hypothetical protein